MQTIKRGEPLPVNSALNTPRTKLGLDLTVWGFIVFVSVAAFLIGLRMVAVLSFPTLAITIWLILRKHPRYFQLWILRWEQYAYYDPRKE
jgi:type IV secretory system VirB3-like protein